MKIRSLKFWLVAGAAVAGYVGWRIALPGGSAVSTAPLVQGGAVVGRGPSATQAPGWVPPEGNPLLRYQEARTEAARLRMISDFMALGHEENAQMLVAALKDESALVRMSAVEQSSALEDKVSAQVLKEACVSVHDDVREMGWSLLAPHPAENRAPVLMASIERASDAALEEAFTEMGRVPETVLFEAMLGSGLLVQGARQQRVLRELQTWLEPGGGEVPVFASVAQLSEWWKTHKEAYDTWMLRVDQ